MMNLGKLVERERWREGGGEREREREGVRERERMCVCVIYQGSFVIFNQTDIYKEK